MYDIDWLKHLTDGQIQNFLPTYDSNLEWLLVFVLKKSNTEENMVQLRFLLLFLWRLPLPTKTRNMARRVFTRLLKGARFFKTNGEKAIYGILTRMA